MPTESIYKNRYKKQPRTELELRLDKIAANLYDKEGEINTEYKPILEDLQANILKHHNKKFIDYHFIRFKSDAKDDKINVRKWLKSISEKITSAEDQIHGNADKILCVYLTYSGYKYLELSSGVIPDEQAFSMGLDKRIRFEKENGNNKPEFPYGVEDSEVPHIIILFASNEEIDFCSLLERISPESIDKIFEEFKRGNNEGIKKWYTENNIYQSTKEGDGGIKWEIEKGGDRNYSSLAEDNKFKEGMGNPQFFPPLNRFKKNLDTKIKSNEISPLSLVLREDKGSIKPLSCGSYGAFLKLEINEDAILKLTEEIITNLGKKPTDEYYSNLAKAYLIGRFHNGSPLTLFDEPLKQNIDYTNNFDYSELIKTEENWLEKDVEGKRCPMFSHIRKANIRLPGMEDKRIVRRGNYYNDEDSKKKGLLFLSFQNSLENQFEYILNNWILNNHTQIMDEYGETSLEETGPDILFSPVPKHPRKASFKFPKVWNSHKKDDYITVALKEQIVKYKGGIYFFAPSIQFFKTLGVSESKIDYVPNTKEKISKLTEVSESDEHKFLPETGYILDRE